MNPLGTQMSAALPTPSSSALLGRIPAAARCRRYLPALTRFFASYAAYLAFIAGALVLPGWLLKAVCVVAAAGAISRLYVLGHDAGHGSLVSGRRLNRWIARLAFLPAYAPLASWHRAHVLLHHNFLRVRGRDMAWVPWSLDDYRRATRLAKGLVSLSPHAGRPLLLLDHRQLAALSPVPAQRRDSANGSSNSNFDRFLVAGFAVGLFIVLNAA